MSEVKDPAIKLFGKTIQLPLNDDVLNGADLDYERSSEQNISCSNEKYFQQDAASDSKPEDGTSSSTILADLKIKEPTNSSGSQKQEQSETSTSQDKPLKKPDKILPCPRCSSMDTKFCYFNNYNVNQPRHFCKNCQRYWTAGGSMRNVPVGAGRRKSKNIAENKAIEITNIAENVTAVPQAPCFSGPPWPHPWAPPFVLGPPPPYWGPWGMPMPWMQIPSPAAALSAEHSSTSSSPNSPLGKHTREGRVLTPKTLRIDDPNEAAKSSIWATLGIRNEKSDAINSIGLFRGFKSKGDEMMMSSAAAAASAAASADSSLVMQANPAALSRSVTFHESAQ